MKILLTGATGLIGKEVGKMLVERGHEVIALSRDVKRARQELPFKCTLIEWKGGREPIAREAVSGVQAVINLMGENLSDHRWSPAVKVRLEESRVAGTRSLIEAFSENPSLQVWLQGSAIGIYGESARGLVFDENSKEGNGFLSDLCRQWEGQLGALPAAVRQVILRTGIVLSHQGGAFPKMMIPLLNGFGGVLGRGTMKLSLIHLNDVARFVVHALDHANVQGPYNLVSQEPVEQKQLVSELCRLLNVPIGPPVPPIALKLAMGEMSEVVLGSSAVVSLRLNEAGFKFKYPDLSSILPELTSWYLHPFRPREPVHIQYSEQFVPMPLEEVFPFFSDARNLESITPEWLNFRIQSVTPEGMGKGTRIRYRLRLHGVPMGWLTDIAEWEPPIRFVDNQVKGPYTLWYHEHRFHQVAGGTLITDWVRFRLPFGKMGQWMAFPKVKKDVLKIFSHRKQVIEQKFGIDSKKGNGAPVRT